MADGKSFLQVLEGDEGSVASLIERLGRDPRHHDMVTSIDRQVEAPEFGYWSMAMRHPGEAKDEFSDRVRELVAGKSLEIREQIDALINISHKLGLQD